MYGSVRAALRTLIPEPKWRRITRPAWLGTLRRTTPLCDHWGHSRGMAVDRRYVETFLAEYASDIRGRVLEVMDSRYTDRFGRNVERRDILDIDPSNPRATIIADLTADGALPPDRFQCFVLTQVLQLIYDTRAAVANAHRALRPGGVLLVTVPSVSRVVHDYEGTDYWRFTPASCERLFGDVFGADRVTVRAYGNVLTAAAFLYGMAAEELSRAEFEAHDASFPVVIGIKATKGA